MHLATLRIQNFKALRDVEIRKIPKFMVVVGANGSGKTSLFEVFFLQFVATLRATLSTFPSRH